ncbi:Pentatricopeptide repeat-containing protein 2 [Homalodisca vitripennis]|nr:Pentatricopeptide repeat-containing protein 2 [Homalodisca vitripennis]
MQFSELGDRFRAKMKDFVSPDSVNMVFTEDLKHMVHLADATEEDLELIEEMMLKSKIEGRINIYLTEGYRQTERASVDVVGSAGDYEHPAARHFVARTRAWTSLAFSASLGMKSSNVIGSERVNIYIHQH